MLMDEVVTQEKQMLEGSNPILPFTGNGILPNERERLCGLFCKAAASDYAPIRAVHLVDVVLPGAVIPVPNVTKHVSWRQKRTENCSELTFHSPTRRRFYQHAPRARVSAG